LVRNFNSLEQFALQALVSWVAHVRVELKHAFDNFDHFGWDVFELAGEVKGVPQWAFLLFNATALPKGLGFAAYVLNVGLWVVSRDEWEVFLGQLMAELADDHSHLVILTHTFGVNSVLELPRNGVAGVAWEQVDVVGFEWAGLLSILIWLICLKEFV
jgi:hypothetical protein